MKELENIPVDVTQFIYYLNEQKTQYMSFVNKIKEDGTIQEVMEIKNTYHIDDDRIVKRHNMSEEELTIDNYLLYRMDKIPENRREFVREKLLASRWIPYEEQKPPLERMILTKQPNGTTYGRKYDGCQGEGISKITHWKFLIE